MKYAIILIALLGLGCNKVGENHEVERAGVAAEGAQYALELDACYDIAFKAFVDGQDSVYKINADYEVCHAAADAKHKRKK